MSKRPLIEFAAAVFLATALGIAGDPLHAATHRVTVVLVHGAFENSSILNPVIAILQRHGVKVVAVQNPLTSLAADVQNTVRNIDN